MGRVGDGACIVRPGWHARRRAPLGAVCSKRKSRTGAPCASGRAPPAGREGVSNVLAAALWTLDGCFEVAAAGAVGVNLHQVTGERGSGRVWEGGGA